MSAIQGLHETFKTKGPKVHNSQHILYKYYLWTTKAMKVDLMAQLKDDKKKWFQVHLVNEYGMQLDHPQKFHAWKPIQMNQTMYTQSYLFHCYLLHVQMKLEETY